MPAGTTLPRLAEVRDPYRLGGRYDTLTHKFVGPCENWRVWLVGEKQFDILFNPKATQHNLIYSAEGVGKTTLMSQWVWIQVLLAAVAGVPGNLGATAPTSPRLDTFIRSVCDLAPISSARAPVAGAWGTLRLDAGEILTCSNHLIQFKSTKQQSAAIGSPLQGYNFGLGIGMDELQDSLPAFSDAVARLRAGANAPIFGTATAKDSSAWRSFRDALSDKWTIHRLSYREGFAVHDSHWEMMQGELSPREWNRRGLALDVGPESALYPTFVRTVNLAPLPLIGAKDVTSRVLSRYGANLHALLGHDPGAVQDVTEVLKAFQFKGEANHRWYVVGEFRTERTTSEEHSHQLLDWLQTKFGLQYPSPDEPKVLLRMDPYGTTDSKTDRSVYLTFRQAGFDPRSAAFKNGKGNGRIPKEARIEMVNSLLCNAKSVSRLFIATDDRGKPCAPLLVESLEMSERDAAGQAEMVKKRVKGAGGDLSDPTAALGYALWQVERVRPANLSRGMVNA